MDRLAKVSIIVPCFQAALTIKRAVSSVLSQDYQGPFEAIVSVSTSPDGTLQVLKDIQDPRIKVLDLQGVYKPYAARELALKEATGDYIAFLDADDAYEPDLLKKMIGAIEKSGADAADCSFYSFDGKKKKKAPFRRSGRLLSREEALSYLLGDAAMRDYLWSKVFKASLFRDLPFSFPPDLLYEDLALNFALLSKVSHMAYLQEPLYLYSVAEGGSLMSLPKKTRALEHLEVFALLRVYADRTHDQKLKEIIASKVWRMDLSLRYDIKKCRPAGLSAKEGKVLLQKLRLLKKKDDDLPLTGEPWEDLAKQAFR